MTDTKNRTSAQLLAQSWFALSFTALLIWLISVPFMIAAPLRDAVRIPFWAGYGGYGMLLLALAFVFLRLSEQQLEKLAGRTIWLLRGWRGVLFAVIVVEVCVLMVYLVRGISPSLTPVMFVLLLHCGLLLIILQLANRRPVDTSASPVSVWAGIGIFGTGVFALLALILLTGALLDVTGMLGTLRGNFDYRELVFYGGETNTERSKAYWRELGAVNAQWLPYTYSRVQPLDGKYINVSTEGLRYTPNTVNRDDAPTVFVFGGSTVWGDGARNAYTIPAHLARLLDEAGTPAHVTNFGQVAYVQMQDMILFQTQLAHGNVPDVAVFYGGFNDIMSTTMHDGITGLPHNEIKRAREFVAGRLLDAGQPLLRIPRLTMEDIDFSLVTSNEDAIQDTAAHYFELQRQIRAVADAYDVEVVFVFQPALNWKTPLTPEEAAIQAAQTEQFPIYDTLYEAMDEAVREDDAPDRLILTDLFIDVQARTFIDRVHITEDGNARVAEAVLPMVQAVLRAKE